MEKNAKIIGLPKARAIAFYLPQFHPIPENDVWWEPGFTEWTNVSRAKPLYAGHAQPKHPADLGYYDLRVPEVRQAQAALAKEAGIEGFCYWHYWFGNNRKVLERPLKEVLESGDPNFPFCICWANESWTGVWHGASDRILIEQTYPGEEDYKSYFQDLLTYFRDKRYIRVDGKPLFVVYSPQNLPNANEFTKLFQQWAIEAGLPGLYLVSLAKNPAHLAWGFQAFGSKPPGAYIGQLVKGSWWRRRVLYRQRGLRQWKWKGLKVFNYQHFVDAELEKPLHSGELPVVVPNWDNTPRSGRNGLVLEHATPEAFGRYLRKMIELVQNRPEQERIVFIKAWNEWAEGNYLEPDKQYGRERLKVCRESILSE
ncbi:MAG: glycoside hydrolase family 99-like domain-containing protein [Bacteroidota bacterium]